MAGGLSSLRSGCSALGASVRDEIHRWDAESGSPAGFYGAPLSRQEGPRGQSRPGDSHSHFPPPTAGEEAGATAARVVASGATHTPILGVPLCGEKGIVKSEHLSEPFLLLPVESRQRRSRDRLGCLSWELPAVCARVCRDLNILLGEHLWGPRDNCALWEGGSQARFSRSRSRCAEP